MMRHSDMGRVPLHDDVMRRSSEAKRLRSANLPSTSFKWRSANAADLGARRAAFRRQPKKIEDLSQRKSQIAASPDEMQPPHMLLAVDAVITRASRRRSQDPNLLVIADRHNFDARFR